MNAIQINDRFDFYTDLSRSPRAYLEDKVAAVNDAVVIFCDNMFGDLNNRKIYDLQFSQQTRDNLATLIKKAAGTITTTGTTTTVAGTFTENHINKPTDYYNFVALECLIDGLTVYSRPTSYGEIGPLRENTYKKPGNSKIYHNEDSTGLTIWRGTGGTFTSASLTYIKKPQLFSLGASSQYLTSTSGNLTNGAVYIACEETVFLTNTYVSGTEFTATANPITSGRVILKSNTATLDLPEKTHETIAKMAANIFLGVTGNLQEAAFVNNEVNKNN